MRLLCLAPFLFGAIVIGSTNQSKAMAQVEAQPKHGEVTVQPVSTLTICDFNRLLPSPSSTHVAVWLLEGRLFDRQNWRVPNRFVFGEFSRGSGSLARLHMLNTSGRAEPLRWDDDKDLLLFRHGSSYAAILDARRRTIAQMPDLDLRWQDAHISILKHGAADFYRTPAALRGLDRVFELGEPLRLAATIVDKPVFIKVRFGNGFRYELITDASARETAVSAAYAERVLHDPVIKGEVSYLGAQEGAEFLAYSRPLYDLATGHRVGRFGWSDIQLGTVTPKAWNAEAHFGGLATIKDAVANGDAIFALVEREREQRIVRIQGPKVEDVHLCEKKDRVYPHRTVPNLNALPPGVAVRRRFVDLGGRRPQEAGRSFAHLYTPANADGRLVVYLHGGPTATMAHEVVPLEVNRLAARGVSVLAVEQSGMVGGGLALSQRLPRLGIAALKEDVEALAEWIPASGFSKIFLVADSFGGASAAIAAVRHSELFDHIFMRAPFLALRAPEQSVDRKDKVRGETPPASQLEWEETVYGGPAGRDRFGRQLQDYVHRLRPSDRLSIYFGDMDPVSSICDLPAAFRKHPSVIVLPRTGHEMVGDHPAVWRDLRRKMGEQEEKPELFSQRIDRAAEPPTSPIC